MAAVFPDDVVFAGRLLRKSPGFTVVATLSLALAIGANTIIFSVAKQLLFDRLPVPDPRSLRLVTTPPSNLSSPRQPAPVHHDRCELLLSRLSAIARPQPGARRYPGLPLDGGECDRRRQR